MSGSRDVLYEGTASGVVRRHGVEEYGFEADTGVTVDYSVRVHAGPNVDVIVVDPENLDAWCQGRATSYYSHLSALDVASATRSGTLPAGRHFIVVDNTSMGRARPPLTGSDDAAAVSFELMYIVFR